MGSKNIDALTICRHPELQEYMLQSSLRMTPAQAGLKTQVESGARAVMAASQDQAQFFQLLLETMGANKVLEIGVFRGSTTLAMALALPEGGRVVGLDITEEYLEAGRKSWADAGVAHKIEVRLGCARQSLEAMLREGGAEKGSFDFAFIDADKEGYDFYYESCLQLLRPGGLVAVDNVFWGGKVLGIDGADASSGDLDTRAIHRLTQKIAKDDRVTISLLPLADGVMLCRKRPGGGPSATAASKEVAQP